MKTQIRNKTSKAVTRRAKIQATKATYVDALTLLGCSAIDDTPPVPCNPYDLPIEFQGLAHNVISEVSISDDGQTIYITTKHKAGKA